MLVVECAHRHVSDDIVRLGLVREIDDAAFGLVAEYRAGGCFTVAARVQLGIVDGGGRIMEE
jgi:hypothetical protein